MPIVIGLGQDDWKDPLNLYGGKAPEPPKVDTSTASSRVSSATQSKFSDSDRTALVDTIIAEAGGEGTDGMKAVAAVIKNRADRRGKSPLDIIKEPDQFTGYSKPGEGALKAMKDPVIRQEAENVLNGMFSGSIADPTGGADHYHADYVNPSWAGKMKETAKIGRHLFYTSGQGAPKPAGTQTAFAPGIGIDNDKEAPFKALLSPEQQKRQDATWLKYANQGATRSLPIAPKLESALGFLPDMGLSMEVFSGGQPTKAEGGPRTGSERHDHGGAADVFFYKDGRRLDWSNPQDVPLFQAIVQRAKANGVTGFGAGDGYMQPGSMHIGFGKPGVWGAGGHGTNAPDWLRTAFNGAPSAKTAYADDIPPGPTMADPAPKGLVLPGNIDLTKRPVVKNDDGTISTVRSMSFEENGKEILVPTVSPDGRLLSQADAIDLYHQTGQHLGVFDNASDATSYAQKLHAQQDKLYAKASATAAAKPIVFDPADFKDPMGLYGGKNPFVGEGNTERADPAQEQAQSSAQAEQNRMNAYNEQHNATIGRQQQLLEASDPGRYTTISEDELNNWTQQWKKDNQSTGTAGDIYRMGKSGTANLARSADNLSRMLLNQIPLAGPALNKLNDAFDQWVFSGKTRGEMLQRVAEKADASVSDAQLAADDKRWTQSTEYTDAQGNPRKTISMGDAWRDPRAYLSIAVRSAPETIATMAPAGLMARGAYMTAIASGMAEREAAAASAKTATLAGSALEGAFGGSDSALNVRDQIAKLPPEVLQSSAAYKSAIAGGMSPEQAVKSISDDAETQAFILSGVATGMFGGMGDRALAKIISEGVSGGIVRRSVTGAVKGVVSEGVLEEMPQSALSQVAENKAMQTADPRVNLSDNVVEQAVGGLVGGGLMGSAFGGVGGAASRADEHTPAQPEPGAAPSPIIPAAPAPKGPLGRAVQHAEEQTVKRTQRDASEAIAGMPVKGATVRVDHEGVEPFMGRVEGHDGDEVVVFDSHSGEVFQVPRSSVTQIADSPENIQAGMPKDTGPAPINDSLPDFSADPALEPAAPIAGQTTSEPIPDRSGTIPALDRLQGRPQPGQRVIVDDGKSNRFSARIQSYEEGRTEALVKNDAGEELQVPVSTLHVDKSTTKQVEAEELKRNPPIERELGDAGPNSRKTFGKTVVFPDEDHAALYDLAKDRAIAKKLGGAAYSDLDRVSTDEVNRLAGKFKVGPQDLISMADDYRYRADDAGREARSALPVNMHGVNSRLLRQAQNKLAKANGADAPAADDLSHWWDVELTQVGRRNVLEAAGVKRPDKVMWEHLTPKIREKLAGFRVDESGAVALSADAVAENADSVDASADTVDNSADTVAKPTTFTTAKGSAYVVHDDGTTTRNKAERSDPGHEGDKGIKPRTARTIYLDTNASVLSAAGLNGMGAKGARVAIKDGKATLVTWRDHDSSWGASEGSRDIPFTETPKVGAYPLELWNKADDVPGHEAYSRMHAGNKITEVGTADTALDSAMEAAAKSDIDKAAHEAATSPRNDLPEPTQAQKEAGNYKVGKISLGGLNISIENPERSARKGVDANGTPWSVKMQSHYGYILGTVGKDKDHIDVFVKPGTDTLTDASPVFVIDQRGTDNKFDEHKVMLGFATEAEARKAYMVNYTKGWRGLGDITETTLGGFKRWLAEGNTSKPFAPKWFTTAEKADAYVAKNGMQATHQVEARNRRFEIWPVDQPEDPMPEFEHEDGDPEAFRRAPDQEAARDAVYKRLATRMTPKEFVQHVSTQGKNSQEAALVDKEGKLLVIKPTTNTNGDHAGIMEELHHAGVEPETYSPWMRVTAYGTDIGVSGEASPAGLRTLNALKGAAERAGISYLQEAADTEESRTAIEGDNFRALYPTDADAYAAGVRAIDRAAPREYETFAAAITRGADGKELIALANKRWGIGGIAPDALMVDSSGSGSVRMNLYKAAGKEVVTIKGSKLADLIRSTFTEEAAARPGEALPNATAPEHVQTGVDDRELGQIVEDFNTAQADMMSGEHPVSNVFQPPAKKEVVRLNDKVKVYTKDKGWMTPAEAKAEIAKWKDHAQAQGKDPAIRSANSSKIVLSLFDLSGEWSRPWEEAGYQVYRFDIQADPEVGDVNNFSTDFFGDWFGDFDGNDIYAILAACPCTDFAVSGARHFAAKDADGRTVASVKLVHQTLRTIEYFKPAVWALENPVGRIEELGGLPPWRLSFDPNHLGDTYTKKTLIWGRFNGDLPIAPVEPTEGSKMHKQYGGKSLATKNARSVTPEGFSYGFFMANNAHDNMAMAFANKFDRLDRNLIKKAIDAGIDPETMENAIEDHYYMDLDDDAANQAIRDLIDPPEPPAAETPDEFPVKNESLPEWFGKSKVVDSNGNPLAVYHGTSAEFENFDPAFLGSVNDTSDSLSGFWFAGSQLRAQQAARDSADVVGGSPRVMRVYLKMQKPLVNTSVINADPAKTAKVIGNAKRRGHDGVIFERGEGGVNYVVFSPDQIRSADVEATSAPKAAASTQATKDTTKAKKPKAPKLLDRLENYFQPGRRIPSYGGGTDEVVSFARGEGGNWTATVAQVKPDGTLDRQRTHSTTPDERELRKWEKDHPVRENGIKAAAVAPAAAIAPAADTSKQFANNKVFTADAVEAARARLKAKMSQLNSGIDPEMMMDGMTIAGAYIESGVRNFADYAGRMTADFGDGIKPYLLSFWEGARNWPNIDTKGMTSADESRRMHAELVTTLPASEAEALGAELKAPKKAPRKGRPEDRLLEGDYGVEHIDGYGDSYDRESGNSVKDAFLKDASGYLKAAADRLTSLGYVPVSDKKGRPLKAVSVNPAGDAVSGEASLHMINPDSGIYVYADIQGGALRNAVPTSPSGIYTMLRASTEPYGSGFKKGSSGNLFAPLGITAGQLADLLHKAAGGVLVQEDFTRQHMPDPSKKENGNELAKLDQGSSGALAGVSAKAVPDDAGSRAAGQSSDERGGANPDRGERVGNGGDLFGGSLSNGAGKLSVPTSGGNPAAAQRGTVASDDAGSSQRRADDHQSVKEPTSAQHEGVKSAAVPAQNLPVDYAITDADELGAGGQKAKYKANVDAIRILRTLSDEKRPATRQEQTALAKWVGWGGLQAAFTRDDGTVSKGWEREAAELQQLLTPEEYKAAQSSTRNAHYTSPEIVNAVWQIARRLGFKGGQVLEPSVGAGNFLGLMPGDVKGAAKITGVELDHITGSIAKNLYPTANIQAPMGFEKLVVPDDHFDLAIGNPPFGSEKLYDKQRRALNKLSIHNFFFAKSVAALRPGGVLAMVVTNRFLDGNNAAARDMIGKTADLIGAIRLPNNAFLKNAGTEVTTDIIILRKRMDGDVPNGNWGDVVQWTDAAGKVVPLNQYFVDHPEMMLGDFGAHGTMYGPDEPALIARAGQDLVKDLDRAIKSLPMDIMAEPGQMQTETVKVPETVNDVAVGTAFLSPDGKVHVRKADSLGRPQSEAVDLDGLPLERVSGMLKVRDAFAKLRRAQIDDKATNAQVEMLRAQLNREYDAFVKKHGPINSDVNKRLLRDDPTWPQLAALEDGFDKGLSAKVAAKTGERARAPAAKKAAIFSKRTQQPYRRPDSAANAKDALATTLNELGRVDMKAMSRLYGKSEDEIVSELGTLIYKTPAGGYETADAYLSGNVRQKLAEAERAAADDVEMRRNVTALRAVIPDDIEAIDIDVKAGSPWIPPSHIADFIRHINQNSAKPEVFYSAANAKWQLRIPSSTPAADAQWATSRVTVSEVINAALNQSALSVTEPDGKGGRQLNQDATDAANEKVARVKEEWARWIWQDDTRREELARLYNDTFNTDVLRTYDGSHLTLPGKVGDDVIALRPHQKNFIWRSLQTGTSLADHVVGAGKTFALIASIMEKRRIGQAKKPMLAVPNHLVGQWAADFIKLYPGAKILAATKNDFETANRKQLFARVATGDWDCVIVAHSSFGKIGVSPEIEMKFTQQQMDDLESSITALRSATGEKGRNAKQLTKWRDTLKAKMEKLLDAGKKDEGLTFDELGVDALYVDEAHEFKNLAYSTSMTRVAGLGNQTGSQKAADLYMKSRVILERTGGNNLVFATGTPISNTMAEMYTVQRYLDEKALKAQGLAHFDAWARVFGEVVTDWELAPSGKYKLNTRFRRFVNIPELLQRYRSFADVITNDDIKAQLAAQGKTLPLPKVKGGKPENVAVERSPDQAQYIGVAKATENGGEEYPQGSLVYRAEHLPKKAEKGADNMLKVMSDARKAALDMRLIDPSYGDYAGSKVHIAADNIKRIFDRTEADKGTQLVFIDLSTPKKSAAKEAAKIRELVAKAEDGDEAAQEKLDNMSPDEFLALESSFSVYDDLRQKLLDRGIPENQIAFIHDANTDLQKEELFGKVRSGAVRILFGSTPKMGAGTNVQNRLVALHHLDAPWRPSDLEQRDGRGIRQGNELYAKDPDNFEIEIMRYATKQTLDARQWQGIEAKATFIQQIRKGNMKDRTIEDVGGEASNAAEMKAEASGNPLILEEMELSRKLKQMQAKATEHDREQHRIKRTIGALQAENAAIEQRLPAVEADAAAAAALDDKPFAVEFRGKTFEKPSEFGAELLATMRKEITDPSANTPTGSYGDFELGFERTGGKEFTIVIGGAKEHHVVVDDVSNADSTGTAMRIVNTVKKLARLPATDKARMADNADQIPKLSSQLVEWGKADELSDLAARHRRVLDALKPKANATAAAAPVADAASYDAPKANKRPDPIGKTDNDMKSLPAPQFTSSQPIGDQAADIVLAQGKRTGHEYMLAIDDDGSVMDYGTANRPRSTGLNNKSHGAWLNPDRRLGIYHNHPSNTVLSVGDMANLAYPGIAFVWSLGHGGTNSRGALASSARELLDGQGLTTTQGIMRIEQAARLIEAKTWEYVNSYGQSSGMTNEVATDIHRAATAIAMHRAGIIDFHANKDYDFTRFGNLDDVIEQSADAARKRFYGNGNGHPPLRRYDRRAFTSRHIADMAGASSRNQPDVAGRSNPTGLAETGERGYSRKEGRAGQIRERAVDEIKGKLTDIQPALLKTIPLNYFTELAQSGMTAVGEYLRVKRLMDAYRGDKHAEADKLAQDWLKYTRNGFMGKDRARAQELADLMHDSTIAGIDPSSTEDEEKKKGGYEALRRRYMALPPKGRELYAQVRDSYREQADELDKILLDNVRKAQQIAANRAEERYKQKLEQIKASGLTGLDLRQAEEDAASRHRAETTKSSWAAKARLTKMRIAFESSRVEAPYFPLGRFGRYFVTLRDLDGTIMSFSKFETAAARDRFARDLRSSSPGMRVDVGVMERGDDIRKAMDPRIVAEIQEILGGAGVDESVMDQIWQRYLDSMPDLSTRKRFIHRKGTEGYNRDALRVYSSHMFHASHQMARAKFGLELQELVGQAMDQARDTDDPTKGVTLANELGARHKWVMNPTGSKVAQIMTSTAFVWYLAASPASAILNMTQTPMMGMPVLAGRFGSMTKAASALLTASYDSLKGKGSVADANLTRDEKKAMEAFYSSGLIDRTQSHDLAGAGDTGVEYSPARARVMGAFSWAFHRAEVWNREVTALAAYRMARDAGQDMAEAIDTAHDLTWRSHFDYSNSSRPSILQNDVAKVALVFRQYNINMLYRLFRDMHQSIKGASPQLRREARYQLAGITGMMALMAGVSGTVGFHLAMALAGMVFGDDDDPMDFEQQFRADVVDILGPQLGGVVLDGVPGHYLGVDLTSRIGMPDLWFRSPNRELQGKDEYQYWLSQTLGATTGIGEAIFTGANVALDGDVARGIEMAAPKFVRDLMKSYRYATDGLQSFDGDEILSADSMGPQDLLAQAMGFTPARVSETWERNNALKGAEHKVVAQRQQLVNAFAMAAIAHDEDALKEALDDIRAFNAVPLHFGVAIKKETLERSLKTRASNRAKREDGVLIRDKILNARLRAELADRLHE